MGQSEEKGCLRFLALFLFLASTALAQSMPRPDLTPGAIRTTDATELCAKSFRTKKYRIATEETKKKVCANYGVQDCPHQGKEELDDLVALEIGGENVEANLWVQMAPEYHWKDRLEGKLKKLACAGKITFAEAQQEIRADWVAAYRKYVGKLPEQ